MTSFLASLTTDPTRCTHGYAANQHPSLCPCAGLRAKARGQAIATAAHPSDRAKVEAAVRQLAATGRPFTANEARALHGVKGPVVGATFTALKTTGVIKPHVSSDPLPRSTAKSTNGHHLFRWIGAAA